MSSGFPPDAHATDSPTTGSPATGSPATGSRPPSDVLAKNMMERDVKMALLAATSRLEMASTGKILVGADGVPVGQPAWLNAGLRRGGYDFRRAAAEGRVVLERDGLTTAEAAEVVDVELKAYGLGVLGMGYSEANHEAGKAVLIAFAPPSAAVALQAAGGWPTVFTARELVQMNMPAPAWLVEGVLPQGVTLLAGKPKSGKSFMAQGIAFAVASGGVALGKIAVMKTDALYLYLEGGLGGLKERIVTMARAGMEAPDNLTFTTEWPRGKDGIDALAAYFESHPACKFVVIDTLTHFRTSVDGSSSFGEEYEITAGITKCCTYYGVSAIIVHHASKRDAVGLDSVLDLISGTTGLVAGVDNGAVLANSSNGMVLAVVPREMEQVTISIALDKEIGTWRYNGDAATNAASDQQQKILKVIDESPEPLEAYVIAQIAEITPDNARKQLQRMWQKNPPLVQQVGKKWSRYSTRERPALGTGEDAAEDAPSHSAPGEEDLF